MPLKKTPAVKAQAKPASKPKAQAKPVDDTQTLRAEIAELKKQVKALSSQCSSCCAELESLRAQDSKVEDARLDVLLNQIKSTRDYKLLKKFITHNL